MEKKNITTLPGAGPFYFEGNEVGVIIIHGGGGGTCADLKPLAEALHQKEGWTVRLPLLPGFGTTPEDLRLTPISVWKSFLDEEIKVLKQKCKKVFVGGHSMGGLLSLFLATKHKLNGIFSISAPKSIKGAAVKLAPVFSLIIKYHPTEAERFRRETHGEWVGYDLIPINIVKKMKSLLNEVKRILHQVTCPALLMQGRLDTVIGKRSMDYIFDNIKSQKKKRVWLERMGHPILFSAESSQIELNIIKFIKECQT